MYYVQQAQVFSYDSAYTLYHVQNPTLPTKWLYLYADTCLLNQGIVEQIMWSEPAEHRSVNEQSDGTGNDKLSFRPVDHHFELTKITGNEKFCSAVVQLRYSQHRDKTTVIYYQLQLIFSDMTEIRIKSLNIKEYHLQNYTYQCILN